MTAWHKAPMGGHFFEDVVDLGTGIGLDHWVSFSFWCLHQVFASILGVTMNSV
jgi:hypothetical protein